MSPISPTSSVSADTTTSLTSSSSSCRIVTSANVTKLFDPNAAETILLKVAGVNIGASFKRLQHEAAPIVNDKTKKLTLDRLPMFMACNYILHLDSELIAIDEIDMNKVRTALHASLITLPKETVLLCNALDEELAESRWVRSKEVEGEEESLRSLYQQLSWKLPRQFMAFQLHNEDTHAHAALDAMMTMVFPASHRHIELSWANRSSIGSKDRRGDANKPDATILKDSFEVSFVEVKPPREERHEKKFLEDQWALATFAKDAIDYHLRHNRPFKTISCLQVFGFQLILYRLEFMSGIYVWQSVGVAYLPRDRNDRGAITGSIALLRTLKQFIQNIETKHYIHTPPQKISDDDLPDDARPRPSNLSPSNGSF